MKLCVIVITLCLLSIVTLGQKATVDGLETRTDQQRRVDAIAQQIDALQVYFIHGADSLEKKYEEELSQVDSLRHLLKVSRDSLSSLQLSLNKPPSGNPGDSSQVCLRNKLDTLKMLKKCSDKVSAIIDSLNLVQEKTISAFNEKMQYLKERSLKKLNDLPPQLSEKAEQVARKIHGFQLERVGLPIPELEDDFGVGSIENLDIYRVDDLHIGNLQNNLEYLIDPGKKFSDVADVQNFVQEGRIEFESVSQVAESKALELSGLSEIKQKSDVLYEHMEFVKQIENPDSLKDLVMGEAQELAMDHFSGKEEQLKQAMETLAKYKSKYPNLNTINEVARRAPNEMKGKPWIERIIPGLSMHIKKRGEDLYLDFNPYAGYKLSSKMSAGVGWNQRVAYQVERSKINQHATIYGPRVFGEFNMWRGFSPRAEVELMNCNSRQLPGSHAVDRNVREWVGGAFVGIKKEYDLIKNLKGTVMMMAPIYNGDWPYSDVLNVRFGFEFPGTKTQKK